MCECPYPFVSDEVIAHYGSARANLPSRYCEPETAARLYDECLDEYLLCDEEGLNVVVNEHHSGINCLWSANPLVLGILARQTRKARILSLGTLITIRNDPVRVAEEYATADVMSRGRLEIGFVKSGGSEMASGNANPIGNLERFWEAIDLITKSLTSHNGPFSWEGKYFTHRHANVWPRAWQHPRPPYWAASSDEETVRELGRRGVINAVFASGAERARKAWSYYHAARRDAGLPPAGPDRFAYMGFTYVGETDAEALRVGKELLWFLDVGDIVAPQYSKFLPGAFPPRAAPAIYRSLYPRDEIGHAGRPMQAPPRFSMEQAIAQGTLFVGNPDTVCRQILDFHNKVGGFEHLILMGRSGFMTHEQTETSIRLFAREVLPRLREATRERAV
jgi:alkanesulfonate monooxygenase SsuD/methylene tetrahydromethanopterin reductase-like flavin-dependent oxidoreductase (luciferase family)